MKRPNSRRNLDLAIERAFGRGRAYTRARAIIANVIVGQMLPDGAVKGGSSIKLRLGDDVTRYTTDLDVARKSNLDAYVAKLESSLAKGWDGFTGRVVAREPASPKDIPSAYVMQPFDVKLDYNGKSWVTVELEVGHDEIGDADEPEPILPAFVVEMFEEIGLPAPDPVPLMPVTHQIAQKLHGLSEPGSHRAHDLIDLQLIVNGCAVDWSATRMTCERLFAYRRKQEWPPTIIRGDDWDELYHEQSGGLDVIDDIDEAVAWGNGLVGRISGAF